MNRSYIYKSPPERRYWYVRCSLASRSLLAIPLRVYSLTAFIISTESASRVPSPSSTARDFEDLYFSRSFLVCLSTMKQKVSLSSRSRQRSALRHSPFLIICSERPLIVWTISFLFPDRPCILMVVIIIAPLACRHRNSSSLTSDRQYPCHNVLHCRTKIYNALFTEGYCDYQKRETNGEQPATSLSSMTFPLHSTFCSVLRNLFGFRNFGK